MNSGFRFAITLTHPCFTIKHACCRVCWEVFLNENFSAWTAKFFFISVHIRCEVVYRVHASYRGTAWCFIFLFTHSNVPSVQHTSRWPSPWSTVTVSRTSGRLPFCYTFCFFSSWKNKDFYSACRVYVFTSVRCTIVALMLESRLTKNKKNRCIRSEWCRRENSQHQN